MKRESKIGEVKLIDLLKVLIRKKWWFIGTFIIVFITGILFTFLRTPLYSLTSTVSITSGGVAGSENLLSFFPEESNKLFSISNIAMSEEIKSDAFMEEVLKELNYEIGKDELKNAIYTYAIKGAELKITIVYSNSDMTYELSKVIVDSYIDKKRKELDLAFDDLIDVIDIKMADILSEIKDPTYYTEEEGDTASQGIELDYETYYGLEESKNVLLDNKDFYINRVVSSVEPDISNVHEYFNYKRDIIFSFFLAIAMGLITVFTADYFQSLGKRKIHR